MGAPPNAERIPRTQLYSFVVIVIVYLLASIYMATSVFPREPVLDYGIGTTTRSTLWAGPIGALSSLSGPGAYFGVLAYLLGSGMLLWLIRGAFFSERRWAWVWYVMGALAWWFLAGAAMYGPGYTVL